MRRLKDLEELLVDHMEGDLEASFKKDLDLMMANGDKKSLNQLKVTKEVIRQTDEADHFMKDHDFSSLHDKIMASVEREKIQPRVVAVFSERRIQVRVAMVASMVLVVGAIFGFLVKQYPSDAWQSRIAIHKTMAENDILVIASADSPDVFAGSLISDQNDTQFLIEAAAQKISQLSDSDAERALNQVLE